MPYAPKPGQATAPHNQFTMGGLGWRRTYKKTGALFEGQPVDSYLGHLELSKMLVAHFSSKMPTGILKLQPSL